MKTIKPLHNPLFPSDDDDAQQKPNAAADLARQQLEDIYKKEPDAKEELSEAETARHRSKHQQFMHELNNSGKSLADIQTAWHEYYIGLPDQEKHQVWREFYANHARASQYVQKVQPQKPKPAHPTAVHHGPAPVVQVQRLAENLNVNEIKQQLLSRIQGRAKVKAKRSAHAQSLAFGVAMGTIVAGIFLFGFFNERFLAPFITPSKQVSSTPIIIDPASGNVGPEPKIIIPKINVEIPVIYDEPSIDEAAVQRALEGGVLHYATTPDPGELGNGVIFGHSSNNILNKGKYKFAFVMLKRLEAGDTFMLHKDGRRYVYKVFDKKIVKPEEVSVLGPVPGKPATMTLITCDPPGTSLTRLVVFAEQISPDPAGNVASRHAPPAAAQPEILPSNAPTLWSRIYGVLTR